MSNILIKSHVCLALLLFSVGNIAQPIQFSHCDKDDNKHFIFGAECGSISIALDHSDNADGTLDIYVMRIPALSRSNKPPIFFIAGGPGQASSDLAKTFRYQFSHLLTDHDFVFVDQRGTGRSHALNCDIDPQKYAHLPSSAQEKLSINSHRECLENYDHNTSLFNTGQAVVDLELIRKAMSYPKIFLWGGSYGTRVIIEYLRHYGDAVRGAILDGLAPVQIQLPNHTEEDANRALEMILQRCESTPACNQSFPHLKKNWLTLMENLQSETTSTALKHPRTEKEQEVFIDHIALSAWVRAALYNRELSALLPLAMHSAISGDYAKLYSMQALGFEGIDKNISEGMHFTILCAEDRSYSLKNPAEKTQLERLLHLPSAESFEEMCALYPLTKVADSYFSPLESEVPSLLLSGGLDPVTPPKWAELVKLTLPSSRHVVAPGGHHIVSTLGCIPRIIGEFVESPEQLKSVDMSCVEKIKPLDFFIDIAGPELSLPVRNDNSEQSENSL